MLWGEEMKAWKCFDKCGSLWSAVSNKLHMHIKKTFFQDKNTSIHQQPVLKSLKSKSSFAVTATRCIARPTRSEVATLSWIKSKHIPFSQLPKQNNFTKQLPKLKRAMWKQSTQTILSSPQNSPQKPRHQTPKGNWRNFEKDPAYSMARPAISAVWAYQQNKNTN